MSSELVTPLKRTTLPPPPMQQPIPQPHPELPLDQWDSNELLKTYLKHTEEPSLSRPLDISLLKAKAAFFKTRIKELKELRASLAPRRNPTIDTEFAAASFKRKVILWLTFPINNLPTEILILIFRMVLHSSEGPQQAVDHRLHLTWVCGLWRSVLLNDKLFWNIIWFRDRPPYNRSLAWVDRAGFAPLEVRINEFKAKEEAMAESPKLTKEQMDALLDRLLTKFSTIRTMVVVVEAWPTALSVLQKTQGIEAGPALLERFELHRTGEPHPWPLAFGGESEEVNVPVPLFCTRAPQLQWLVLSGVAIDWAQSPLANLTTLDLRRMPMRTCPSSALWTKILLQCPRMYRLSLDAAGPQWPTSDSTVPLPIPMLYLRELFIGDSSVAYTMYILTQIKAPGLQCLTLMNFAEEDFGPLIEFLVGRFPDLRILALYNIRVQSSSVNLHRAVRWLDSLPQLRYLKMSQVDEVILRAFLEDPGNHRPKLVQDDDKEAEAPREIVCPLMTTLAFHFLNIPSLLLLTEGRKQLGSPFTKVYGLPIPKLFEPSQLSRFKDSVGMFESLRPILGVYTEEERSIHYEILESSGQDRRTIYYESLR